MQPFFSAFTYSCLPVLSSMITTQAAFDTLVGGTCKSIALALRVMWMMLIINLQFPK